MQNLKNTQLPQTQNEEKNLDTQVSNNSMYPSPSNNEKINGETITFLQPFHVWLFSLNTWINTSYLLGIISICNQVIDNCKADNPVISQEIVQEQIQQELSKTLKIQDEIQENKKQEK